MDPVTTAHSVLKIIWEINNAVKEVEENREQCEYLAGRLSSFELILHNEKLRSHAQFGSLVSSLKIFIEEAKDFVVGFLPKKSVKKNRGIKKQVKNQVRRVADFLSSFANRKDHAKRFLELDARLTKWRDDINAVTGIVTRVDLDHSTMMDKISLNMKNELVREINKVRDEVCRGATLPPDIEAFRRAPEVVQAVVDELSTVDKVTNSTALSLSSPQLQHFVAKTVEDMILISRTQQVPVMETVFPSDEEDIHERFQLQDRLGMPGSYGVTFRATYTPDGRVYAVKRVDAGRARHMGCSSDLIEREAYSLKKLTHRHIVRFYHSFFDEPEEFYYLVMELVPGMTLGHYVTSRPRPELLLKWLQQLTSALVYMHGDCRMVHRDLKPANIMITQDMEDVKLIDFGLARVMADSGHADSTAGRMTAAAGTTLYMSYEKLEGLPYDGRDDVWAVGCIFVELILQQELKCVLAKDDAERAVKVQAMMMMQNPGLSQVVASILEGHRQEQRPSSMELLVLLGDVYLSRSPLSPFGGTDHRLNTVEAIDVTPVVHSPQGGVVSPVGVSVTSDDSPAATSTNTSNTTRNGRLKQEEPLVSLTTLSSEEAVRLLVSIGCATDLRQRVDAMMMEMLDGSFLMEIDDFEIFYELEQTPKTIFRTTHYRKVLKKLQALQRAGGVSRAVFQALRDQTKTMLPIIDADQSNESIAVPPISSLLTHGSHPVAASETLPVLPQIVETRPVPSLSSSSVVHGGVDGDEPAPDSMRDQMTITAVPAGSAKGITESERNEMLQNIKGLNLQEYPKESIERLLLNDPTLITLDLSGIYIGDAKEFATALRINTTLTALNLSGYILGATRATELASALRENATLTTLNVSHNVLGPTGAAELASALRDNTTLMTLNLSYNVIGAAGAKELAVVLRENPTLTTLMMSNNVLGVRGAKEMASALRVNKTLTTLDLGDNVIGTEGAAVMASALRVNTTLTTLDLRGNVIRATGATEVVSALRENKALTMLDLRDNGIEAAGAMEIAFALRGNTTLMTLDLRDNGIEAAPDFLRDIAIVNNNVHIVL